MKIIVLTLLATTFSIELAAQEANTVVKSTAVYQIGNKMICPVTGEEFTLNKNTPKLEIEGKTYYFCCRGCIEKFKKDYQKNKLPSTDLDIANEVVCPVMGTKFVPNSKSPKLEYKGKIYYFCCAECVDKFKKEPEKYIKVINKKDLHKHKKGKMCECKKCGEKYDPGIKDNKNEYVHNVSMTNEENKIKNEDNNMSETKLYTMEEVVKHNKKGDCWLVINNKVYDVSEFTYKHNENILLGCGRDATKLFETRTTEDGKKIGSGMPHSENARKMLEKFYKGNVKK